jgi:16S rRNA (cytosine1402-N4)-methyltransferase
MEQSSLSSEPIGHIPVLAEPIMELFDARPGMVYLDCTAGRGGHASMVAQLLGETGHVIALDADPANADFTRERLASYPCKSDVLHRNFAQVTGALDELGVDKVDLLLADLGFASNQMDDPTRGMTFQADGPLDMRLNPDLPTTAEYLVNHMAERELADILFHLGEERLSRRIAKKIVQIRDKEPIKNTLALAELVSSCYPPNQRGKRARIHPATRTFMALRIAVNEELMALERLLDALPQIIKPGGIAAIISFHSLEDRRVKQRFLQYDQNDCAKRLTRKPIVADDAQIRQNPRSRSAKLRAVQFSSNQAGME